MPKLLSRSKYKEFESNSALLIRNQKERRAENARKIELQEIWQAAKFSQPAKFAFCIFGFCSVHPRLTSFCDFSYFSLHVLWVLRVFLYFCLFEHYLSSNQILWKGSSFFSLLDI